MKMTKAMCDDLNDWNIWNPIINSLKSYALLRQPGDQVVIKPLSYEMNGLEPIISEQSLRLHYDGHHQAFVDDLNEILPKVE